MVAWGQGLQGAIGGGAAGFAAGGPLGGLIGGGLGFAGGLLGGEDPNDKYKAMLEQLARGYQGRQAPQAQLGLAGNSSLMGNRGALIAQLEAMSRGEGPSAARLQMQQGMDRAVAAQASAAAGAGGRGVNAGAALRNASNNSMATMAQGNRDMGVLRAQEQANAVGQLGQNISQGINADNSLNTWNAGATNQNHQFNAQMMMQQLGLNDASQLAAIMGAMGHNGPGLGTSLLAGGAGAVPGLLQWRQAQQQGQTNNGNGNG